MYGGQWLAWVIIDSKTDIMQTIKKSEAALIQVLAAIDLIRKHDFVSAVTLAGAGYEILSKLCKARKGMWTQTLLAEDVSTISQLSEKRLAKLVNQEYNSARNKIKHQDSAKALDEVVEADFFNEASKFVSSALECYRILFNELPQGEQIAYYYSEISRSVPEE
jgi:hypothetical protein